MNTLITAQNICVQKSGKYILNNVSTTIKEQDFITIIGPNGAGKSTFLKCLMGLHIPHSGTIIHSKGLTIGYVPQRLTFDSTLPITVKRFLTLRNATTHTDILHIAKITNITSLLERSLVLLSGGEIQRVLLARSLIGNPQLLILDEPAQNLDISGQLSFYKLLNSIYQEQKLSIVMVSHDLHMVMASTKQVICLFHHVCCSGEPHAVTKDPEFISLFGDDMANMMAVYQHSHNHLHTES